MMSIACNSKKVESPNINTFYDDYISGKSFLNYLNEYHCDKSLTYKEISLILKTLSRKKFCCQFIDFRSRYKRYRYIKYFKKLKKLNFKAENSIQLYVI